MAVVPVNVEVQTKFLGIGIGLRREHFNDVLSVTHQIDWFEIISENFMNYGGRPKRVLDQVIQRWPVVCHGLGLSLGSQDPLNPNYIELLKGLLQRTQGPWFSDHLCLSSSGRHHYHDLIPILRTEETAIHIIQKIKKVQQSIELPFAIENISSYVETTHHTIGEEEFLNIVLQETNAWLLLDINNVYVNSRNHHFDPYAYLEKIPSEKVIQIHLAGHLDKGELVIDTHGAPPPDPVWDLYRFFLQKAGRPISTLIEWDNNVPSFAVMKEEVSKAKAMMAQIFYEGPHETCRL